MWIKSFLITICSLLAFFMAMAQNPDTTNQGKAKKGMFNNIFQQVRRAIFVNKKDSAIKASVLYAKSEAPFLRYQGKIIRHITTQQLGFEKRFEDTSSTIKYFGTRILNRLHIDSRSWVI